MAVGVDGSGNVVLTGTTAGTVDFGGGPMTSAGGTDVFIAKYNSSGGYLWARLYGGANSQRPVGLAVDSGGNIAIAGTFVGTLNFGTGSMANSGEQDVFVAKLSADGSGLWSQKLGFPDDTIPSFSASDVAMDPAGNVILTGTFLTGLNSWEGFIQKFSTTGATLWDRQVSGIGNDGANAVATDTQGNTLVAGYFYDSVNFDCGLLSASGFMDAFLVKLSP
jgi:hypothetical protein